MFGFASRSSYGQVSNISAYRIDRLSICLREVRRTFGRAGEAAV